MSKDKLPVLIERLLEPARYPHPVEEPRLIETHISWVILTGQFAYKLKKPLDLGFLDFSTLESRRRACEEELRLNARLAPGLYLSVTPISGTPEDPQLGGSGPAIEYAVQMHEFPQDQQLDRIIRSSNPDPENLEQLFRDFGARLADFHASLPAAGARQEFGSSKLVARDALENFAALAPFSGDEQLAAESARLRSWTEKRLSELEGLLQARKEEAFIREGHGDLHLRNLVLHDDEIVPFDCIEFSPALRWIDVMSDVAFLFMDLVYHQRRRLAYAFMNAWLAASGDYGGLRLLRFYSVYRAMVRAKIAGIELLQHGWPDAAGEPEHDEGLAKLRAQLELAAALARKARPMILITHGVSGTGKTWVASRLAGELGAIHVRSDVERKRLFGMAPEARSSASQKATVYGHAASEQTYARVLEISKTVVAAGLPVVADATFLRVADRDRFARLARQLNVPFVILDCQASVETLRARVARRARRGGDASEADLAVLEKQLSSAWQLEDREAEYSVVLGTDSNIDFTALRTRIEAHTAGIPGEG